MKRTDRFIATVIAIISLWFFYPFNEDVKITSNGEIEEDCALDWAHRSGFITNIVGVQCISSSCEVSVRHPDTSITRYYLICNSYEKRCHTVDSVNHQSNHQ